MDVTVTGRRCSVSEKTKETVTERTIETIQRLQDRVTRADIEFTQMEGKHAPDESMRVEITLRGKGPVVRAAGEGENKMMAFDAALDKLKTQLRKAADRRKTHRGLRAADIAGAAPVDEPAPQVDKSLEPKTRNVAGLEVTGDGPLVVREKNFSSPPLTLAQALDEMELVGHDFFLFRDADTDLPAVVYRRKAYDYGVIRLSTPEA